MTEEKTIATYVDACLLIVAFRDEHHLNEQARNILKDRRRSFLVSDALWLELLPKAVYNKRAREVEFYERFFARARRLPTTGAVIHSAPVRLPRATGWRRWMPSISRTPWKRAQMSSSARRASPNPCSACWMCRCCPLRTRSNSPAPCCTRCSTSPPKPSADRLRHKTMFCVPCGFGYAESADSCYTSRPWRVSPHCVAANLVRAGRQQP